MNARDTPAQRAEDNAVEIVSTIVVGFGLAALFLGVGNFWVIFLLGFVVFVPLVALLFGDEEDQSEWWDDLWAEDWWDEWWSDPRGDDTESASDDTPGRADSEGTSQDSLSIIRRRYARGELTDAQFERKLERLLETETLEDVEDRQRARELLVERE